jgi:hypothetical protein
LKYQIICFPNVLVRQGLLPNPPYKVMKFVVFFVGWVVDRLFLL